jgi:hypothetical protein
MSCRAFNRFVEETETSAIIVVMRGFSSSRLNALAFFLPAVLSFLAFEDFEALLRNDVDDEALADAGTGIGLGLGTDLLLDG